MMTRRQVETEMTLLARSGFILDWTVGETKDYEITFAGGWVREYTLAQAKVVVDTLDFVRRYPTTIAAAAETEAEWRAAISHMSEAVRRGGVKGYDA